MAFCVALSSHSTTDTPPPAERTWILSQVLFLSTRLTDLMAAILGTAKPLTNVAGYTSRYCSMGGIIICLDCICTNVSYESLTIQKKLFYALSRRTLLDTTRSRTPHLGFPSDFTLQLHRAVKERNMRRTAGVNPRDILHIKPSKTELIIQEHD